MSFLAQDGGFIWIVRGNPECQNVMRRRRRCPQTKSSRDRDSVIVSLSSFRRYTPADRQPKSPCRRPRGGRRIAIGRLCRDPSPPWECSRIQDFHGNRRWRPQATDVDRPYRNSNLRRYNKLGALSPHIEPSRPRAPYSGKCQRSPLPRRPKLVALARLLRARRRGRNSLRHGLGSGCRTGAMLQAQSPHQFAI